VNVQAQAAPPSEPDSVVAIYCASWSTADRAARDRLLNRVWAVDGVYSDASPMMASGRAALSDSICSFQSRYAGTRFHCSPVQVHHGMMRFTWAMIAGNGKEQMRGMDFGELAADGRIRRITGFFGPPPEVKP
jgi:hypothetical protein